MKQIDATFDEAVDGFTPIAEGTYPAHCNEFQVNDWKESKIFNLTFTIADEDDSQAFSSSLATVGITYQSNQQGNFFLRGILNTASAGVHYSTNTTNLGLQAENSGIDGNEELQFSMCYYTA